MKKILPFILSVSSGVMFAKAFGTTGSVATQGQVSSTPLLNLINLAQNIVSKLVPLAIGVAMLAFFWFLINFIWIGRDDPKKHQDSMKGMGYSILALFVMVSIWGIVMAIASVFGVTVGGNLPPLEMPGVR